MGLIKGSMGGRTFRVNGVRSEAPTEWIGERLDRYAFRQDWKGAGSSNGWTRHDNMLEAGFRDSREWSVGSLVIFSFRMDNRQVPGALLRAHLKKRCAQWLEENAGVARVPAAVRRDLRETVTNELIPQTNAKTKAMDVCWDTRTGLVTFAGTNTAAVDLFKAVFRATFECDLESTHPMQDRATPTRVRQFYLWLWWATEEDSAGLDTHGIEVDGRISLASDGTTTTVVADQLSAAPEPKQAAAKGRLPKALKLRLDLGEGPLSVVLDGEEIDVIRFKPITEKEEGEEKEERETVVKLDADGEILSRTALYAFVRAKVQDWVTLFSDRVDDWDRWYNATCYPWLTR